MLGIRYNGMRFISFKREVIAIFLFGIALFIGCALYSHYPDDHSWFHYTTHKTYIVHNWCGLVGAHISALLLYLFGSASIVLSIILLFFSYLIMRRQSFKDEWERFAALGMLFFVGAALHNFHNIDFFSSPYPGGLIGLTGNNLLYHLFNRVGSGLFLYCMLYVCFILLFRFSFMYVIRLGVSAIKMSVYFIIEHNIFQHVYKTAYKIVCVAILCMRVPFLWFKHFIMQLMDGRAFEDTGLMVPTQHESTQDRYLLTDNQHTDTETNNEMMQQNEIISEPMHNVPVYSDNYANNINELSSVKNDRATKKTYALPNVDVFVGVDHERNDAALKKKLEERAFVLQEKLERFGICGSVTSIKRGPVVTLFEYQPQIDTKLSKILALEDDLAMALRAHSIRILAPIPGRSVVGFEVANAQRTDVLLADAIKSKEYRTFSGILPLVLGQDTVGNNIVVDLARMPHLLIAGSTGSGKSVALNAMLMSLLCARKPDELKLILIDPKRLEFASYADIAHLLFPIVADPKRAAPILRWVVYQMEQRYECMATIGARNIFDYNALCKKHGKSPMPFIVVVIDELADLMMLVGRDVEDLIARITQMARAAGIHLIVATQRPSVDVITGLIKVNFPSRISFRVTSRVDSRTILDCGGADKLLGRGDMLFLDSTKSILKRVHGAYVSDTEIEQVVSHIKAEQPVSYLDISQEFHKKQDTYGQDEQLYECIVSFLQEVDDVSISLLQRKFRIGYNRSARIIDMLEVNGLIMPAQGSKTRRVIK